MIAKRSTRHTVTALCDTEKKATSLYKITPIVEGYDISHSKEWFMVEFKDGSKKKILLWDYQTIYQYPHLYDALIVEQQKSRTHEKSPNLFLRIREEIDERTPLRILDFAAGSGLVGEHFKQIGQSQLIVGIDRLEVAKLAALRDRPEIYDHYFCGDIKNKSLLDKLISFEFNCIFALSSVGTGDADLETIHCLFDLLPIGGWFILNVRRFPTPDQQEMISALIPLAELLSNTVYFHRFLVNNEKSFFRTLVYRKEKEWEISST